MTRPVWLGEERHVWDHVRVHNQLIEDDRLSVYDRSVWLAIAYHANVEDGGARPNQKTLAELAKCSDREVRRSVKNLVEMKWIKVVREDQKRGRPVVYSLLSPPLADSQSVNKTEVLADSQSGVSGLTVLPLRTHSPVPSLMNKNHRTRTNEQEKTLTIASSEISLLLRPFEEFWKQYPSRHGKKIDKAKAQGVWKKLIAADRDQALAAVPNYQDACDRNLTLARDAHRWLRDRCWVDWQEPAPAVARNDSNKANLIEAARKDGVIIQ